MNKTYIIFYGCLLLCIYLIFGISQTRLANRDLAKTKEFEQLNKLHSNHLNNIEAQYLAIIENRANSNADFTPLINFFISEITSKQAEFKRSFEKAKAKNDFKSGILHLKAFESEVMKIIKKEADSFHISGILIDTKDFEKSSSFSAEDSSLLYLSEKTASWNLIEHTAKIITLGAISFMSNTTKVTYLGCWGCYGMEFKNTAEPIHLGETRMLEIGPYDHSPDQQMRYKATVNGVALPTNLMPEWSTYSFLPKKPGWDSLHIKVERYDYKGDVLETLQKWVRFYTLP